MADVFIVTGEASGDAVGAGVANHLRDQRPDSGFSGIGATRMLDAGVRLWANSRQWAAIGFVQAIPMIGRLIVLQERLKRHLLADRPKVLLLVDFGAFNVRLGAWAVHHGIRTVYLMPPGSWRKQASMERLERLARSADLFLSPFAWNAENLRSVGADAVHIGHPVLDMAAPTPEASDLAARLRPAQGRLIALLPGSRRHEAAVLAPMLAAVARAWPHAEDRFVMVQAPSFSDAEFSGIVPKGLGSRLTVVRGGSADPLHACDLAVVCAGTATLEGAVALKPMVVVYRGPWLMHLEWQLRKRSVNARFIAMPNIIADHEVARELVDVEANAPNVVAALTDLADDPERYAEAVRMLGEVRDALRPEGALKTAASRIAELL